jgi:ABC-type lipoprotein release transport system permease subunit
MLGRSELRRRWRSVVVLTLLVAFAGAVVLALTAGARRTSTSLDRFDEVSRTASLEVDAGEATPAQLAEFRRTPGVAAVAELRQFPLLRQNAFLSVAGQVDERFGTIVDKPRVIEGRLADQRRVDEITIGETLAATNDVKVGDTLHFHSYSPADIAAARASNAQPADPHGPDVSLRIVGIVRRPLDLGGRGASGGVLVPTVAFTQKYRDQMGTFAGSLLRVRTEHRAADVPTVSRAARRIFGQNEAFSVQSLGIEGQSARDAVDVATVGLYVAAAIAAVVGLVGLGIALSREVALVDGDQLTLRALGMRPGSRVLAAAVVALPVALGGAGLAVAGAVLLSPLFPIGVGALAEPDPGLSVDGAALALGALGVLVAVVAVTFLAAARLASTHSGARTRRPARTAATISELGAPPPMTAGVQFALDQGRTRPALPVRSSLIGATAGILVVVGVLVFAASLDHLVTTPDAYGWTWDTTAGDLTSVAPTNDCGPITTRLSHQTVLADVASVCSGGVTIAGRPVAAWGFQQLRGRIEPLVVEGHAPRADDEVALGADALSAAGVSVGDHLRITGPSRTSTYRIVGQSVMPGISDPAPLADSAVFTSAGLARLGDSNGGWDFVVRFAPGVDRAHAMHVLRAIGGAGGVPIAARVPTEIDRVRRIDGLPVALAVFVSIVALVAVGFALVTTVRRRRRALAVLKTLGFDRRQVRATVAWQATTVVVVGLVVGIPLGLVAGRFVWGIVADELGVSSRATWPVLALVLLVLAALAAVNLIAAVPARRAAHTRPAVVLRSE